MGQRLNIEILDNGEVLANAYYHWSGYTSEALLLTKHIVGALQNDSFRDSDINVVTAIKLLEVTGAGLTNDERSYAEEHLTNFSSHNFRPCISRNDGLLAISPEGIENTRSWEEARVGIDLAAGYINLDIVFVMTKDDFQEEYDPDFDSLPVYDFTFSEVPFSGIEAMDTAVMNLIKNGIYFIRLTKDKDEHAYVFIE